MLQHYNWLIDGPIPTHPVPLPAEAAFIKHLETVELLTTSKEKNNLCQTMGFNYRQVVGELLWPCVIKLSQYLDNPAKPHYLAASEVTNYLAATITKGIYYWCETTLDSLPDCPLQTLHSNNYVLQKTASNTADLTGMVDSDWAADSVKRKSILGIIIMLAGGYIAYKSKYQDVIALSTTEAEFVAACNAGKLILFFRLLLKDLVMPQDKATILYEDNHGALMMANAQQPTRQMHHIDLKHFSILDWVERDLLLLEEISTHDNAADAMTKCLPKILFYRHLDTYMGRRKPDYVQIKNSAMTA